MNRYLGRLIIVFYLVSCVNNNDPIKKYGITDSGLLLGDYKLYVNVISDDIIVVDLDTIVLEDFKKTLDNKLVHSNTYIQLKFNSKVKMNIVNKVRKILAEYEDYIRT